MSRSTAKKKRLKRVREGKVNPEMSRGHWNGLNPVEKKPPTLKERVRKLENKHKRNLSRGDDGSVFFIIKKSE
jgi:hypothetical protein